MVGPFWVQQVATTPTWSASDTGRIIYDQLLKKTFYASDTAWVEISNSAHTHTGVYLPIAGQATDSDKLDGLHAASFALLSGGNTLTGTQNFSDGIIQRAEIKDYSESWTDRGTGGDCTFDLETGNNFQRIVNAAAIFTFSNPPSTTKLGSFSLFLVNGGSFAITWPTSVTWPNNTTPTLGATSTSYLDVFTFITFNGGSRWYGNLVMKKMPV